MPTLFERIVSGEIPCHKVWESAEHLAFLDINPRVEGHTLLIPKRPVDYLFDLSDAETAALWIAAKGVAQLLQKKLACRRVCVSVIGWEVPHCHVHLLPTNSIADFKFPPVDSAAQARLAATAKRLAR
jgi:histidine triad (HIT) family protein